MIENLSMISGANRASFNEVFAEPKYSRQTVLNFLRPSIDANRFNSWLMRGFMETTGFTQQTLAGGTGPELEALATKMYANEMLGKRRRYSGSDLLQAQVLNIIGQSSLPFSLAYKLIHKVQWRAAELFGCVGDQELVLYIVRNQLGEYKLLNSAPIDDDWFMAIRADVVIRRFFEFVNYPGTHSNG